MHENCRLLVCLFSLSPPEEKTRRKLQELWGGGGVGGSFVQDGEARGGWGRQREAWNRPVATVQQACIGECRVCVCVQRQHRDTLRSEDQIFTDAVQDGSQGWFVLHSRSLLWHTFPNDIHVDTSDRPKTPFGWCGVFVQAVIVATRANVYCWLTDRRTDRQVHRTHTQKDGEWKEEE